jgi:hypothetical protein
MKTIKLEWKSFKVNTVEVEAAIRAIEPIDGISSDYTLNVHVINDEVSDAQVEAIHEYWNGITLASPEATSYIAKEERMAAEAAKKASDLASAKVILKNLGLSDDQIAALRG